MAQEISSINFVNNTTISQEYPQILVDKKLFESSEEEVTPDLKVIERRRSKSGMRKAKSEVQNQPNLKEVLVSKNENIPNSNIENISESNLQEGINQELLDILIKYGKNPDGIPTLHYAIKMQDINAIELLLEHGADINANSNVGLPLEIAFMKENYQISKFLIENGATATFDKGYLVCLKNNFLEGLQLLIDRDRKAVSEHTWGVNCGYYLTEAIKNNISWIGIEFLIENGSKDRLQETAFSHVILTTAIRQNNVEVVKGLIEIGIDVNGNPNSAHCPLLIALGERNIEIANLLIEAGVILPTERQQHQMMASSLWQKDYQIVRSLIDLGMSPEHTYSVRNYKMCSVLQAAILDRDIETVEFLLEKGANVNRMEGQNKTPLKLAIEINCKEIIELLLEYGADLIDI